MEWERLKKTATKTLYRAAKTFTMAAGSSAPIDLVLHALRASLFTFCNSPNNVLSVITFVRINNLAAKNVLKR
jgi:hypothetical protein